MKPPALTIYLDRDERRRIRRIALEAGLSASALGRLAVLTVARQVEEALRRGTPAELVVERLTRQAEGAVWVGRR
ncbi:MAG: hypothetical protein IMX02_06250 [Limnochordaceae bacterium]|nr:hypothetical protein [Limnochordaceae bacterium]